jgi:hypothetical protein
MIDQNHTSKLNHESIFFFFKLKLLFYFCFYFFAFADDAFGVLAPGSLSILKQFASPLEVTKQYAKSLALTVRNKVPQNFSFLDLTNKYDNILIQISDFAI